MNFEREEPIHYDRELLKVKMEIQRAVIVEFCKDIPDGEAVEEYEGSFFPRKEIAFLKWTEEYSSGFREIFERRLRQEDDFLLKYSAGPSQIVAEIVKELKEIHEFSFA